MTRILFISNLYPHEGSPDMASFNRQQVESLSKITPVDVVAPVAWCDRPVGRWLQGTSRGDGTVEVSHPTYFYTPGVLRALYGRFFYLSARSAVRDLVAKNRYSTILGTWLYPDGWASACFARELGIPFYLKVHGTDVNGLNSGSRVTRQALQVVSQAKGVFCVSQALKRRLLELGAPEEKLHVLYNGIDRQRFSFCDRRTVRDQLGLAQDGRYLLYVGNLKKNKGLGELVEAFAQIVNMPGHDRVKLLIVGQGPYGDCLLKRVKALCLEGQVQFSGARPLDEIPLWMNACDLLCLPSYMEGVPNVVLEAMACGAPVVASRVGGIPELTGKGGALTLVPPKAVGPLVAAIEEVLMADGRPDPVEWPSWDDNVKQLTQIMTV